MSSQNQAVILVKRPVKDATPDCFQVETQALAPLAEGEIRVAVEYVSVDAGARTMLMGAGFHRQVPLGGVVLAGAVGRIVASRADGWAVGQAVRGHLGAQTMATLKPDLLEKVDGDVGPLSLHLGLLGGSTGVTAWIGMMHVAKVQPGDVFVVSAAAGAVGCVAGQIAKKAGARVIGIAGGDRKGAYLTSQLGFDAVIDYKSQDVASELKRLAPSGINVFFDNVGGAILDAVLDNLALRARVVICGAVSQYDNMAQVQGPSLYLRLAERQSAMEGFAYFHFPDSIAPAKAQLSQWIKEGSIALPEEILQGIESYPEALGFMFSGGNLGKLLIKV
ncbi:MAG: NADP-dependent oxidoreductase [Pseudomonadales bacterium]|jgi:NADPH-dependent curcumin reductase CurA|tara:strand:+ start:3390 stop:4391 length:1002 start_codon:yes stop_codon:yes gene_type:complete